MGRYSNGSRSFARQARDKKARAIAPKKTEEQIAKELEVFNKAMNACRELGTAAGKMKKEHWS